VAAQPPGDAGHAGTRRGWSSHSNGL